MGSGINQGSSGYGDVIFRNGFNSVISVDIHPYDGQWAFTTNLYAQGNIIVSNGTSNVYLADAQSPPHFWKLVNNAGTASFTDAGTICP